MDMFIPTLEVCCMHYFFALLVLMAVYDRGKVLKSRKQNGCR